MRICELFACIAERMAAVHGSPLPRKLLKLGNNDKGWYVVLNNTSDKDPITDLKEFWIGIEWNGFPAGIITPGGGTLAAGDAANEETFREWLKEAV